MILALIPTENELNLFLDSCRQSGQDLEETTLGRLPVWRAPEPGVIIALGGLGKVQFAVRTQHLLDSVESWEVVFCAGAAGALSDDLAVGDVVVSTVTIEHDIRNGFGRPLLPRFPADAPTLSALQQMPQGELPFRVYYGPVASGDEDVITAERREDVRRRTGALAVAWEGAGGARACEFSGVPYLELRGISDRADGEAGLSFVENLPAVMGHLAAFIFAWAGRRPEG